MPSASLFSAMTNSPNEINNKKSAVISKDSILCMIVPSGKGECKKNLTLT
jgi:hypothetical protein